jgi:hypothetical protein
MLLVLIAAQGLARAAPPARMVGTWDVIHVAVDGQDTIHQTYDRDDPRLMAGILVVDGGRVKLDPGDLACHRVPWTPHPITWQALIAGGFPRPRVGGRSSRPTPDDFGLELLPAAQTTAYSVCAGPKTRFPTDSWAASSAADLLLLRYDAQVLLVLKRRPPDARPSPSFDCARTANSTEATICQSFPLAAWDRSVALALKQVSQMVPERSEELKQSQAKWVRERNGCGTNAKCIDDSLQTAWRR